MGYEKQFFEDGQILTAEHLNKMERGIEESCSGVKSVNGIPPDKNGNVNVDGSSGMPAGARLASITLLASSWTGTGSLYSQVVSIDGVTENTQVNLAPSVEQLAAFYEKDVTFVTENDDGVVTVYVIGQRPQNDYTIQANLVEVIV